MNLNDKEQVERLISACRKGERKSQRVLYEMLYGKMLGVCMRYSSNMQEAEDMVHDGFIKVFDKIKSFENKGSLEAWITRLMVNHCIDVIRKKKKLKFQYQDESNMDNIKDEAIDEQEDFKILELKVERIVELMQKLTPAYQMVFNLYVVEDMTHNEIAQMLNISEGTSKSNFFKAKKKLRELYNENYGHENEI